MRDESVVTPRKTCTDPTCSASDWLTAAKGPVPWAVYPTATRASRNAATEVPRRPNRTAAQSKNGNVAYGTGNRMLVRLGAEG